MTNHGPRTPTDPGPAQHSGLGESGEYERMAHALSQRFAPHVEASAAQVRAAEHGLAHARERLQRARARVADEHYRSDPLVFMRASVKDEVAAVGRKTTPKKIQAAHRYLVDRALELAEGEVQGFVDDLAAAERERQEGVDACLQSEREALARLEAARQMQDRVREAEGRAIEGLSLMVQKLAAEADDAP